MSTDEADLYTDEHNAAELRKAGANGTLGSWIKAHLSRSDSGDYVALLAYIARDPGTIEVAAEDAARGARPQACRDLRRIRPALPAFDRTGLQGRARQRRVPADHRRTTRRICKVPGQKASFGVIQAAQARGDFDVLTERGRRALRVHLKGDLGSGLSALDAAIAEALS